MFIVFIDVIVGGNESVIILVGVLLVREGIFVFLVNCSEDGINVVMVI